MSEKTEALQSLLKTLETIALNTHSYGEVDFLNGKIDEIVTAIVKNDQPTAAIGNAAPQNPALPIAADVG